MAKTEKKAENRKHPPGLLELIDKDSARGMLLAALARGRLGGTLLLAGPDGAGKSNLAFWLAAALNCLEGDGRSEPCGGCGSCRRVATLSHPDVLWLFPVPGAFWRGGQADQGRLAEAYEQKRAAPWLDVRFAEKSEHHLAAIQRLRTEAGRSAYEGRQRVFVITGADRLRQEAANAFLKLLEEPRPGLTLVLCTEKASSLLPTILSRCQRLQVRRPARESALRLLEERFLIPGSRAAELLELADGNLTEALRLESLESVAGQRAWVEKTVQAVLEPGLEGCLALLEERKGPLCNRGEFERYLALLTQLARRSLVEQLSGRAGEYTADGELLAKFSASVADTASLLNLLDRMVGLRDALDRNVNLKLLGWSLLERMRKVVAHEC